MTDNDPTTRPAPLLAVIVDNHVVGDSRVQKCALAAASAGYRVVLVGRAPGAADTFTIGSGDVTVEVRRIEAPFQLLGLARRVPRGRWRYPFAYPSVDHNARRGLRLKALTADLRARKLILRQSGEIAGWRGRAKDLALKAETVPLRAGWLLHRFRQLGFRALSERVKRDDGLVLRAGTRLRTALRGPGAWRALDPVLLDVELGFGPVLDELAPDLLHANDFRMCGVAARAAARAAALGRRVPVVYDVHEWVAGVASKTPRWRAANTGHEAEYIGRADAVITVSDRLAEMLQERYRLVDRPRVVLNAPRFEPDAPAPDGGLRAACGLADDVPLLVYSGSAAPQRGIDTVVDALVHLPPVHLALVIAHPARAEEITARARQAGVADRVHVLPYVAPQDVVPFLRSATAGLIPIHHVPNHEIALITKYFEYAHAGLPIISSDTDTMGTTTRALGNGEVFVAEDVADLVRAVAAVTADPRRYRAAYDRHADVLRSWSWHEQEAVLLDVYADVLAAAGTPAPQRVRDDLVVRAGAR
ncbi:glycosyltransferase [Kineosporia sp. R_H_3]|uniref:glycosyltransferase n=1 Tax=Kineosporia sp. R_H_3 TaxID=1961848 RepID=UPI000B4B4AAC|nr:glycosyltransferase [Kineosporia sp. R_H_3]